MSLPSGQSSQWGHRLATRSSDGFRVDSLVRVDDPFHKVAPLSVDKGVRYTGGLGLLARAAIDLPVIPCLYLASLPYTARATVSQQTLRREAREFRAVCRRS